MSVGDHGGSLQDMINLTENLDCYEVNPNITDYDDLGRYYINELDVNADTGLFWKTSSIMKPTGGMWRWTSTVSSQTMAMSGIPGILFVEFHDGNPENILEEYRVMSVPEENLSKEEIEE